MTFDELMTLSNDKDYRFIEYMNSLLNKIFNLYTIEHDDLMTESGDILKYLFTTGYIGLMKDSDGKYYIGTGSYVDSSNRKSSEKSLDRDGRLKYFKIQFKNGEYYEGRIGEDVVVCRLNELGTPINGMITHFASQLAETDLSEDYLIKYARLCPIPIVNDDLEEKSMESIIDNLFKGAKKIFKRNRTTLSSLTASTSAAEKNTFDLTNPQASAYMQNLTHYHDELIIRACLEFGIYVSERDKGAQMNESELGAFRDYCALGADTVESRLKQFVKDAKDVFGIDLKLRSKSYVYNEEDVKRDEDNIHNGGDEDGTDNNEEDSSNVQR